MAATMVVTAVQEVELVVPAVLRRVAARTCCAAGADARRSAHIHRSIGVKIGLFDAPSACRVACGGAFVDSSNASYCVCCVGMGGAGREGCLQGH